MIRALLALAWGVISFFLSSFIIGIIFSLCPSLDPDNTLYYAIASVVNYALTIALTIIIPPKLHKAWTISREDLGLKDLPTWFDILLGVIGCVAAVLFSYLLNQIFLSFPWYQEIANQPQDVGFSSLNTSFDRIIAFITLVVVAPIAEEIIFRGGVYSKLRKVMPAILAMLLVSVAFAIMHGQWNAALATFALSMVFCAQREITGTIYAGIISHMINNALAFYTMFVMTPL